MNASRNIHRKIIRSALISALYLFGSLLVGFVAAFAFSALPMHMPESTTIALSFGVILFCLLAGGAAWGRAMARAGSGSSRRMALAGALVYGPAVLAAALFLGRLEVALVERGAGPDLPIHVLFTLLFVPAAFFVSAMGGLAIGLASGRGVQALRMSLSSGLAGALAFWAVNLAMDLLGWRVGAPGAAERATMLTVMMAGSLAAALGSGGMIGYFLEKMETPAIPAAAVSPISR